MDDYKYVNAPPCVQIGEPLNYCAKRVFGEQLLNHITLVQEWTGWKFTGRDLVSPDGNRINPERLRGILFREAIGKQKAVIMRGDKSPEVIEFRLITSHRSEGNGTD